MTALAFCRSVTGCVLTVAVKFGRMSKKQRERVEDEANFHKQRLGQVSTSGVCYDDNNDKLISPTNNNDSADVDDGINRSCVLIIIIIIKLAR